MFFSAISKLIVFTLHTYHLGVQPGLLSSVLEDAWVGLYQNKSLVDFKNLDFVMTARYKKSKGTAHFQSKPCATNSRTSSQTKNDNRALSITMLLIPYSHWDFIKSYNDWYMGWHSQSFRLLYQIWIIEVSQCDWKDKIIIELAPNEPLSGFWSVSHEETRTLPTSPSFVVWSCLLRRGSGSRCSAAQASSPPNISSPPKVSFPTFPFVATQNSLIAGSLA